MSRLIFCFPENISIIILYSVISKRWKITVESLPVPIHFRSCLLIEDAQLQKHGDFIQIYSDEYLVLQSRGHKLIQRSLINDGGKVVREGLCPLHSHLPTANRFDFRDATIHGRTLFIQCWHVREPAHWLICDLRTGASIALQLAEAKYLNTMFPADENGMLDLERHSDHYTLNYVPLSPLSAVGGMHAPLACVQLSQLTSTPLLRLPHLDLQLPDFSDYQCAYSTRHRHIIESHQQEEGTVTCIHVVPTHQSQQQAPLVSIPGIIACLSDDWVVTFSNIHISYFFFDFARMRRITQPYKCTLGCREAISGDLLVLVSSTHIELINMATASCMQTFEITLPDPLSSYLQVVHYHHDKLYLLYYPLQHLNDDSELFFRVWKLVRAPGVTDDDCKTK